MRRSLPIVAALLFGLTGPASAGTAPLRVGIVRSFFHDMTEPLIQSVTEPFIGVLRDTTGLTGELVQGGDPFAVAAQLNGDKLQLGVFHGFEFAWVRQKYSDLRPLSIAVNTRHPLRAYVVVPKDSPTAKFADLKGKDLAVPKRTKAHCRAFIESRCGHEGGGNAKDFFAHVVSPANVETGLDELVRGKFQAAVVDATGLDFYKELKPGAFARLRVLEESGVFPPLVVAYRQGALKDATLDRIATGLRAADKSEAGRDMLRTWNITGFAPVPANFAQTLADSLKAYPGPQPQP
jgi:ABC-type phosphate/phosphonate transport system substrate-binding protein